MFPYWAGAAGGVAGVGVGVGAGSGAGVGVVSWVVVEFPVTVTGAGPELSNIHPTSATTMTTATAARVFALLFMTKPFQIAEPAQQDPPKVIKR